MSKKVWIVLVAIILLTVAFATGSATAQVAQANITVVFDDDLIRVYEDGDYGARLGVSKFKHGGASGIAPYCPCGEVCATVQAASGPLLAFTPTPVGNDGEPSDTPKPTEPTEVPTETPTTPTEPPPPEPTQEPTEKPKCNQGLGNGPEGCSPGNSDNNQPPNDEGQPDCGYPGNPCRGGNRPE